MGTLAVTFGLAEQERVTLLQLSTDQAKINYVKETIEEKWDQDYLQELDKSWEAIHRCLTRQPPPHPIDADAGDYPLKLCILGGRRVLNREDSYVMRLVDHDQISDLLSAIDEIDEEKLREVYFRYCIGVWPAFGEQAFEYTWSYFDDLRKFMRRMIVTGRSLLFTVDI